VKPIKRQQVMLEQDRCLIGGASRRRGLGDAGEEKLRKGECVCLAKGKLIKPGSR